MHLNSVKTEFTLPQYVIKTAKNKQKASSQTSKILLMPAKKRATHPMYNISRNYAGRLGNLLFEFAALLGIAETNHMTPLVPSSLSLLKVFNINTTRLSHYRPSNKSMYVHFHDGACLKYDRRTKNLTAHFKKRQHVWLHGFFQSFKYFQAIENRLRQDLQFHQKISSKVQQFFKNISSYYTKTPIFVGIHIRRGDFLLAEKGGYIAPSKDYLLRAMDYMRKLYKKVQFIVASDDIPWAKRNIGNISVSYSPNFNAEEDLALLASCNHTIISSGTYSWWAGWLANGTTIYFSKYPLPNTFLYKIYKKEDYYPDSWIPM